MGLGQNQATGTVNLDGEGAQLVVAGVGGLTSTGLDGLAGLLEVGRNHGYGGGTGFLNALMLAGLLPLTVLVRRRRNMERHAQPYAS
jgi:hypothetical protein